MRDVLSRIAISCVISWALSAPLTAMALTPTEDFQARCNAPGVVKCIGFDNTTTDIVKGVNLWPDGAGIYRGVLDTSEKASGAGSLRFDLPAPPVAGANIAGSWSPVSNDAMGQLFGENSTFYVQFRQRFSPDMLTNTWDSSWKTAIFHHNQLTCAGIELTTNNRYMTGLAMMYTDCGGRGLMTTLDGTQQTDNTPLLMQQGAYNCQYAMETPSTCFYFVPNEWLVFYYKIQVGTWGQANSMVELFVARPGWAAFKQIIRVPNMRLECNTDPCSQLPGKAQGYNNVTLTPYMTGLNPNSGKPGVVSSTWYDEWIVSTQPIAFPGGRRPLPPSGVQVR